MLKWRVPQPPAWFPLVSQTLWHPDVKTNSTTFLEFLEEHTEIADFLLKAANANLFESRMPVKHYRDLLKNLGTKAIYYLLIYRCFRELVSKAQTTHLDFPLEQFLNSSLQRASAAACLAMKLGLSPLEEFYALGLYQDIGILGLHLEYPDQITKLAGLLKQPAALRLCLEQEIIFGHDEYGAHWLNQWRLPEEFTAPIRFHHQPGSTPREYTVRTRIALAAEVLSDLIDIQDKQVVLRAVKEQLQSLGLGREQLSFLLDEIRRMVIIGGEILQFVTFPPPRYEEITASAAQSLLELNLDFQELNEQLRRALEEQQRLCEQMRQANAELQKLATTDGLTGLFNRRAFDDAFERALAQAQRMNQPLSLLLIDVDHFKKFNDSCGHLAGDLALKHLAQQILLSIRKADLAVRYGGEEFVVLLPFTAREGAVNAAERIRTNIAAMELEWEEENLQVTVSIGGTTIVDAGTTRSGPRALLRADEALYQAKEGGRNKVCWT